MDLLGDGAGIQPAISCCRSAAAGSYSSAGGHWGEPAQRNQVGSAEGCKSGEPKCLGETSYLSRFSNDGATQALRLHSATWLLQKNKYSGENKRLRDPGCLRWQQHPLGPLSSSLCSRSSSSITYVFCK